MLLDLERLQSNIELYKEGTQARLDAESEYLLRKQELENSIIAKEDEIEAVLKDGVLTISFTKVKQDTVKKITIQ